MSEEEETVSKEQLYTAIGMLAVFSVVGVIGNALVLYVFSNFKQKLTSTIFILTLAGTDFITCLITIPYTIVVEILEYSLYYNIVCQIYQFLITTTVPFSAFVMVAIAVDRYLCICHPFRHAMTIRRAEYIVAVLCALAVMLGILCCLNYGVLDMYADIPVSNSSSKNGTTMYNSSTLLSGHFATGNAIHNATNFTYDQPVLTERVLIQAGVCMPISMDNPFFHVYQKIYSSFFAICAVIVMVLYAIIYRSVLARRRQRLKIVTNKCCGFWNAIPNETETTEISTLTNVSDVPDVEKHDKSVQKNGTNSSTPQPGEKDVIIRPSNVSRAKLEKMKLANIKTAFMLSIVTLVFIVAFLPSWLVALRVFKMNVVVFYMYFSYNVANPVIYAFMNNTFKAQLKELFKCKS
ncbi:orexin receptor type 1-like [Mizuhopecten yessoensis]|uniref:Orexin receptor type 1 n=1 Tax=Mizuhopecten yessoensis TaxID=6573 RepID=A0A210R303_MIZYE|nr:orexin receptor type 1-like [Mizuhopecten yessoensis]OWF55367.1 Orexin receptor type 1 [Mizuhopecten yessoensis]